MNLQQLINRLNEIPENHIVRIEEGMYYAFRQRGQDFISGTGIHGIWPLNERNLALAKLFALYTLTRIVV